MILRIVRGRVPGDRVDAVGSLFGDAFRSIARVTPGLVRFHAGVRPVEDGCVELVLVTFWGTVEAALEAYGGDLSTRSTLEDLREIADLREIEYFEVDESQLRRSAADARFLRLTFGRVARGRDAEIQHDLRDRMHALEPEMSEAYVGRRIVGDDVEIAFVSAWQRPPASRSLDEPFWPDISSVYDSFRIATYEPLASAAPAGA